MNSAAPVAPGRLPDCTISAAPEGPRIPFSFDLELTARCNNDCRHCYICLPESDPEVRRQELSLAEIGDIASQAADLGALWCLVAGGEPPLRPDSTQIYLLLRRKGLLVSVFMTACLITEEHVALFRSYPPRAIDVTVVGVTAETYERVTRRTGSYAALRRDLGLLLDNGIKVNLRAVALHSNSHEFSEIAAFCRAHAAGDFRLALLLGLRRDANRSRDAEIRDERLWPQEVVAFEQAEHSRAGDFETPCDELACPELSPDPSDHLFRCGAGVDSFSVSYDGVFRLCADRCRPDCTFDLRNGRLAEAWEDFVPRVRGLRSADPGFLVRCSRCPIINLCDWCPAHADRETGKLDGFPPYYCAIAQARAQAIQVRHRQNT